MDSQFVDLDILLTRIREPRSKTYFLEAVRAYKAGAPRAALSSAWVAVVFDLIAKYRELGAMGDAAAAAFLRTWDNATASGDTPKLLELERSIIADATANTQLLNPIAEKHLNRLRDDRHDCAHPAFSTEAELFEPSPELVRLHLVNAIDFVLSQEPLQGKAIFEQFSLDVQSAGFPKDYAKLQDYVAQRYLNRIRPRNIQNFGMVLTKSLLKGVPPEWENYRSRIIDTLVTVRERAFTVWPEISEAIVRLIDSLEPAYRLRVIAFLGSFQDLWDLLDDLTQTALRETVSNLKVSKLTDFRVFHGLSLPIFRDSLLAIVAELSQDQIRDALAVEPFFDLWPRALDFYAKSGSWRGSEINFRNLILPLSEALIDEEYDALLDAIMKNGQNWDAAETPN